MSRLQPIDNGVRQFRPGLMMALCALILIGGGWFIFQKVRAKQAPPEPPAEIASVAEQVEEIRSEPPPPPSIHPLAGKRRLFLADGCRYRFQELTFTRKFSQQHDSPGAVLRENDPCLWSFRGVPDKEDVYRIFCADPSFPDLHQANLTYTRVLDDEIPQDVQAPYLTLREDDYCEWQVRKLSNKDQYEIYCLSGKAPFVGESLGWTAEQEDLKDKLITATLGENGTPSWWILPEDQTPTLPRRASHLIVMNRGSIRDLEQSRENFEEHGHEIFRVQFDTTDDEFTRVAEDLNYLELVKAIRNSDPVIGHPDFPALLGMDATAILDGQISLERQDPLFPLIIPLKVALHPHLIHELRMENTKFWQNEWESLEDFQSHLDESDLADGRIYQGDRFTYIFVSWDR
ncbi:MAG: hypothetical protein ACJAVK_003100 [Akkermansiaceae bacterium]|jgi:hypothetical protein